MTVPGNAKLILTASQANELQASVPVVQAAVPVVQAASAGVGAVGHSVSWSGSQSLPAGEGFILATLTGDTVLSCPPRGSVAESINILVQQDATGGRSLTLPGVAAAEGVAIEVTADAHAVDMLTLVWTGSQWAAFMGASNLLIPAEWVI